MADESNLTTLAALKAWLDPPPLGAISSVEVTAGGAGYTSATASIVGTPGSGAVLSVTIVAGVITAISVTSGGKEYLSPNVVIVGDGAGATATAHVGADVALTQLINDASNVISDQLSLVIAADTSFTETYNGSGKGCMTLRQYPATSVTSVSIGGVALAASANQSAGYLLDASSNTLHFIGGVFPRDVQNVTVTYKAGIPANDRRLGSIERACIHTCALWWKRRPHIDQTSMATTSGLGSISFKQADLPDEAWTIIRQLQRVAPALG
jgi:hypothetical protein